MCYITADYTFSRFTISRLTEESIQDSTKTRENGERRIRLRAGRRKVAKLRPLYTRNQCRSGGGLFKRVEALIVAYGEIFSCRVVASLSHYRASLLFTRYIRSRRYYSYSFRLEISFGTVSFASRLTIRPINRDPA